jgi:metallo-beta-lactamase family protein
MEITFLGATGTVTGSKYLVTAGGKRILIDCGLFQGLKELRLRNWDPLPVDPASIDAVLLTHAHLDHTGYLPVLIRNGFLGKVISTQATRALCALLLPDSGHLQEEEASYANRRGYSKHHPAQPLYTRREGEAALWHFFPVQSGAEVELGEGLSCRFIPAGHILGASMILLRDRERSVLFTGDLGRPRDPLMLPPGVVRAADYLVIESTYGDRRHEEPEPEAKLGEVISRTAARGGVVVIPAFCIGRAQELLYSLSRLKASGSIPDIPVYLNSPMATDTSELYCRYHAEHRLSTEECRAMCSAARLVRDTEESKKLNTMPGPMIIIAGSGMATGGRVVHHLKAFAPDPRNTILLAGYQAAGTRGARIAAGEESIKIHGEWIPVRAEVAQLEGLSAPADYAEILDWLKNFEAPPRQTFITHGEPKASAALAERIRQKLGWECRVPEYLERAPLAPGANLQPPALERPAVGQPTPECCSPAVAGHP